MNHEMNEPTALWAVHAQGPDDIYPAFSREDAEQHAAALNALPCPPGLTVSAIVIPSPWVAEEHWRYLAEEEREHSNKRAASLRMLIEQRDAILQQARAWACEAKTQQATTREVGEVLGGIPDWGPIAAGVEALRARAEAAEQRLAVVNQELTTADKAPSLPAPGSAGEEVEVVAWRVSHPDTVWKVYERNPEHWAAGDYEIQALMTVAQHERIIAALSAQQSAPEPSPGQAGKTLVSAEPLRRVLNALVNAPHVIRELQATREPVALFADNPINVLIAEFNAAQGGE